MTAEQLSAVPVVILGNKIDIQVTTRVVCSMSSVIPDVYILSWRSPRLNRFFLLSRLPAFTEFPPNFPLSPFCILPPSDYLTDCPTRV